MKKQFRFDGARRMAWDPRTWAHPRDFLRQMAFYDTYDLLSDLNNQLDDASFRHYGAKLTKDKSYLSVRARKSVEVNLAFVNNGYVENAVDSLTMAALDGADRKLSLSISMAARNGLLRFAVTDNGTGVDPDVKDAIFKEMIASKKGRIDGLMGEEGVHLYYAKRYIESMDGEVGFEDYGKDKGASFWYSVPIGTVLRRIEEGKHKSFSP